MRPFLSPFVLILLQACLVAALPRPQAGQLLEIIEVIAEDCKDDDLPPKPILTRTTVEAQPVSSNGGDATSGSPIGITSAEIASTTLTVSPGTFIQEPSTVLVSTGLTPTGSVSTTVVANPGTSIQTITLTALPPDQFPTLTSAEQPFPETTGSVNTVLNTTNIVSSQPFPTSIPTISTVTLQPIETTISSGSFNSSSGTNTLTIPIATFQTVITTSFVASVPVPTTVSITQVTNFNSTITTGGSIITSSSVGTTVVTTLGTVLSETTLVGQSTVSGTVLLTVTATGSLTNLPTPTASCLISNGCTGQNIFQPVALTPPPTNIPSQGGHPVPRLGITNITGPIETNKFYANFFLGTQGSPAFVMPYSLTWSRGSGNAQSWGMAVSHIDANQKVFGPTNSQIPGSPNSYYINPLGIQSVILSATELKSSTVMTSNSLEAMSANIRLQPSAGSSSSITFPVVQGMAFVTGLYNNLQPAIQSSVFFKSASLVSIAKQGVYKYRIPLQDGKLWLLYAVSANGIPPNLQLVTSTLLQGVPGWSGMIQVIKVPDATFESIADAACGAYPTAGAVGGYATGSSAEYSLSWTKGGAFAGNTTLLMYALPHHIASFSGVTSGQITSMTLATTTKGMATAVVADYWSLIEDKLPVSMGFAPWRPGGQNASVLSLPALAAIQAIAPVEASQNIGQQSNLDSMYYSGKALSKFASIIWTMKELTLQTLLANNAQIELIKAFQVFSDNRQQYPLLYDTDWKGLVSSATYVTGNKGADFGNSLYNDHHFHYGYFIHAAAIIGSYNSTWLAANKDYVNALVRDVANPSSLDQYFPVFRSFDWYNGHSWAKGLYESGDGKDEESSSEDAMFAYALKMWGKTVGDASMEARGNLMLSVLARTLQSYFLMESDNKNQPASFIANKVTGIMFENKIDHTTYFGSDFRFIQGIHMLPLQPFSTLTRTTQFVAEEWNSYFADGRAQAASQADDGWKGVLYANLANINPTAAYNFFTQDNFQARWLDGGASRTWYIALAAGLGGAPLL